MTDPFQPLLTPEARREARAVFYRQSKRQPTGFLSEAVDGAVRAAVPHVAEAAARAERERIREGLDGIASVLWRPGNGPAHDEMVRVIPEDRLLKLLEGKS